MMNHRRVLTLALAVLVALALVIPVASLSSAQGPQPHFIRIAGSNPGGTSYFIAAAMGEVFKRKAKNVDASVQATGGGVEGARLVGRGEADLAFLGSEQPYMAIKGGNRFFKDPLPEIRGVASLWGNLLHLATLKKSGIRTLADLKGRKVSLGGAGSGTEVMAVAVLKAAGIDPQKDLTSRPLSFNEQVAGLKSGVIEAGFLLAGAPMAAVVDLTTGTDALIIPIDGAVLQQTLKENSYWTEGIIPANTYKGQTAAIRTTKSTIHLVTHTKVPDDVVYSMTKAIFENVDTLAKAHAVGKQIVVKDALAGMVAGELKPGVIGTPLHPGAIRYYKEVGLLK